MSTRQRVVRLTGVVITVIAATGCGGDLVRPDPPPAPAATRDGRWIQDVDYVTDQLPRLHPNLFFATPRSTFESAAQDLKGAIPRLQDHEVVVGLMRLVALIGDGHTSVRLPPGFHRLPLRLARLADGLYVVAAEPSLADALGARLIAVGIVDAPALEAGAARLVSHENDSWLRARVPDLLVVAEVLFALGATEAISGARLPLQEQQGTPSERDVGAVTAPPALVDLATAAGVPPPLHEQRPNENYWFTTVDGSRALYLRYSRCQQGSEPFSAFAERIFQVLDQGRADRLVVDLRRNGGGDSNVDDPLIQGLQGRPAWRQRGRLFSLIDSGTFSSGMFTALDLQRLGAVLVGAPTGGKPNAYGNTRTLTLPNSRLEVSYSTRYFTLIEGSDPPSILPELAVEPTIEDMRTGRDPVLDAALRFIS